eukprot:Opistho-2@55841
MSRLLSCLGVTFRHHDRVACVRVCTRLYATSKPPPPIEIIRKDGSAKKTAASNDKDKMMEAMREFQAAAARHKQAKTVQQRAEATAVKQIIDEDLGRRESRVDAQVKHDAMASMLSTAELLSKKGVGVTKEREATPDVLDVVARSSTETLEAIGSILENKEREVKTKARVAHAKEVARIRRDLEGAASGSESAKSLGSKGLLLAIGGMATMILVAEYFGRNGEIEKNVSKVEARLLALRREVLVYRSLFGVDPRDRGTVLADTAHDTFAANLLGMTASELDHLSRNNAAPTEATRAARNKKNIPPHADKIIEKAKLRVGPKGLPAKIECDLAELIAETTVDARNAFRRQSDILKSEGLGVLDPSDIALLVEKDKLQSPAAAQ